MSPGLPARGLVASGKGILAADESTRTITRRFESIRLASTEETRRAYRELLFTTRGVEEWLSGVILFDETLHQKAQDGTPFPDLLARKGILPGIKMDKGTIALGEGDRRPRRPPRASHPIPGAGGALCQVAGRDHNLA